MEGADFEGFVRGGLAQVGIEPDEVDMAVIMAANGIWADAIRDLMTADLGAIRPEPNPDLHSAPRE